MRPCKIYGRITTVWRAVRTTPAQGQLKLTYRGVNNKINEYRSQGWDQTHNILRRGWSSGDQITQDKINQKLQGCSNSIIMKIIPDQVTKIKQPRQV